MSEHQLSIIQVGHLFAAECECGWYCQVFRTAADAALAYGIHLEREAARADA